MNISPIQLRHKIHQYPELAFQEFKTTELIISNVNDLPGSEELEIHTPFPTGVLFEYKVNDGEFLLFRADIDALPIKEENEVEFKSANDYMHACGHDVHTSILYSFLEAVLKKKPNRNILFLFQPAEEAGGGAMKFYNTGVFNQFQIKNAFALHVTDEYPLSRRQHGVFPQSGCRCLPVGVDCGTRCPTRQVFRGTAIDAAGSRAGTLLRGLPLQHSADRAPQAPARLSYSNDG